jgi:hypothetical protein
VKCAIEKAAAPRIGPEAANPQICTVLPLCHSLGLFLSVLRFVIISESDRIFLSLPAAQRSLNTNGQASGSKKVKDFMTAHPECVDSSETMINAAQKMKKIDTGVLPVCEV